MSAAAAVSAWLEPGETLVWSEAADTGAIVSAMAPLLAWMIVFNVLVWLGIVATVRARDFEPPLGERRGLIFGAVFALIFVLGGGLGLYAVSTQMLAASSTAYGLTDRRVIIVEGFPTASQQSYAPETFARMLAWADRSRLDFDYHAQRKGSDYDARLYVRDPQAWAQRIRETLSVARDPESPN